MAENIKYENDPRPECKYGTKCYQKNPEHSKKFKHPPPPKKLFSIFDVAPKNKRQKLDDSVKTESIKASVSDSRSDETTVSDSKERNIKKDSPKKDSPKKDSPKKESPLPKKFVYKEPNESPKSLNPDTKYHSSPENIPNFIQEKFLVEMPKDFYSFWELYNSSHLIKSFMESIDLNLVGPYDVLSKSLPELKNDEHYLVHWRFYFDPPEFQVNIKHIL